MKTIKLLFSLITLSLMCSCVARQIKFNDVTQETGLQKIGNQGATWAGKSGFQLLMDQAMKRIKLQ